MQRGRQAVEPPQPRSLWHTKSRRRGPNTQDYRTWVDVVSPTADKGHAVAALQHDLGIGADETVVFGDFLNDLGMLDRATYAFAMANAHPDVTARSWRTAPANTSNGVVRTLRALLDLDG